jgi:hypothetical protein
MATSDRLSRTLRQLRAQGVAVRDLKVPEEKAIRLV